MHGFKGNAQVTAFNFSLADDLLVHEVSFICRKCKADTVVIAGGSRNLRVHSDNFATHVDEWSTAVTTIDSGIGLQESLKDIEEGTLTFLLGDDAGCYSLVQTKRRSHCEYPIADLGRI